jgi:hypothetical protein
MMTLADFFTVWPRVSGQLKLLRLSIELSGCTDLRANAAHLDGLVRDVVGKLKSIAMESAEC